MASDTITNNLNEIISTKNEFKQIIQENGLTAGTVFSQYPSQIRSIIGSGGGSYISGDTINSYIAAYLSTYNYIDQTELSANSYITYAVFNNGSGNVITDIQNSTNNEGHILLYNKGITAITPDVLAACGYITSADLPKIDENIVPKENNTYTLGDSTYLYAASYVSDMWLNANNRISNRSNNQINLQLNGSWRYTFHTNNFGPAADNTRDLGESSVRWRSTYSTYIYSGNLVLSNGYNSIDNSSNTRINFKINQNNRFKMTNVEFAPVNNNGVNLGTSLEKFNKTYTSTLYADTAYISNYNNLIWTGTSAQYAALPDYTTYQIYMIKES